MTRTPITIVVPVYGDLPSLLDCIDSLTSTVDFGVDRVLLVNDCGPQADVIEDALVRLVDDHAGFTYARNERNLGFVGTCNRAAFELDQSDNDLLFLNSDTVCTPGFAEELSSVLHSSPTHGAVCPRSNNATIATIPYALRDPSVGRSPERAAEVHRALRETLPRFSIAPVAMGFCILIRRELIRQFGLFDETFAPGYGEENDFCLRVAAHGYQSVISHRSLVFHLAGRSFASVRRARLRAAHEAVLVTRYPTYPAAVSDYLYLRRDPVDVFADAIAVAPGDASVKLLLDLEWDTATPMDAWHRDVLSAANDIPDGDVVVTVAIPDRRVGEVATHYRSLVVVPNSRLSGIWDIVYGSNSAPNPVQLARMNRCGLRWVLDETTAAGSHEFAVRVVTRSAASASELLEGLSGEWSRTTIEIERLRARWNAVTGAPARRPGGTAPAAAAGATLLRRIAARLPPQLGWIVAVARVVTRRD
jgi:GT2 family glycosyltransferase